MHGREKKKTKEKPIQTRFAPHFSSEAFEGNDGEEEEEGRRRDESARFAAAEKNEISKSRISLNPISMQIFHFQP